MEAIWGVNGPEGKFVIFFTKSAIHHNTVLCHALRRLHTARIVRLTPRIPHLSSFIFPPRRLRLSCMLVTLRMARIAVPLSRKR